VRSARRPLLASLVALTVLALACTDATETTGTTRATDTTDATPTTTSAPPTTTTDAPEPLVDRLLVLDDTGNVVTMDRTGNNVAAVTADAAADLGYFQPNWSPDAGSIAVSRVHLGSFSLVNFDLATATQSEIETDNNAFYVYWSPQSDRLAYLSNGPGGLGLAIARFGEAPRSDSVDFGAPLYFAWSPDGDQLATLIGQQRLEVRDADPGSEASEIAAPGAFQNPAWTDAGLFYVSSVAGTDQLVVGPPDGDAVVLARAAAPAVFTVPASGTRVAIQAIGEVDGVSASFQAAPLLPMNRLVVIEIATGDITQVTEGPALAYFWDGAGEQLLILDQEEGARLLRWSVWADGARRELVEFVPSPTFFQHYLPFFGQYALSTTMWSPDGTAFAFPGLVGDERGIFVQAVSGGAPAKIADGAWVTWSPR